MTSPASRPAATGLLLAGSAALLFASKGLFAKSLYAGGVDSITLTTVRALLSLPMFCGLALWRGLSLHRAPRASVALAALAGILCYGAGAMVDFHALNYIDVSLERALLFSYPALIVLWQAMHRRRAPSGVILSALLLSYVGILLVVGAFDAALWRANLFGALLVMASATTTACYFLLGERCIPDLGSNGFTIVAMTAATAFVSLTFALTHPVSTLTSLHASQWGLLLGLAVLCMFLPTLLQAGAIRLLGAERASLSSTVGPPAALFLGVLLLGERPTAWQLLGTTSILCGVVLLARRETR
jgi:drug/metabolite transporter (DMT)-like permease